MGSGHGPIIGSGGRGDVAALLSPPYSAHDQPTSRGKYGAAAQARGCAVLCALLRKRRKRRGGARDEDDHRARVGRGEDRTVALEQGRLRNVRGLRRGASGGRVVAPSARALRAGGEVEKSSSERQQH